MRWYVLTLEDVRWMCECGIDPEITAIEECIKRRTTSPSCVGDPPAELSAQEEAEIPEMFRSER